nr:bifunctional diaminohydroxyphosphoribosylaminopyrimidine deaminase/5-amino-6-(5-phosphoribosylamino)uracil reductase RibD [Reinekea blandensis]
MSMTSHDAWMAQALKLAARGRRTTTPNPNVGCVIVRDGELVGSGYHRKAGTPHAEVHALAEAGSKARGATAYVTLEPCSHYGKTPPCADALIKAGVANVVCAMTDPNPQVAGQGLEKLRNAGIEVISGVLNAEAERLNRGFLKRMRTGRPWLVAKMAASLDGGTALANGDSQWITGPEARQDVQSGRADSCAVVTGVETVVADNPSLNVRLDGADRQPVRIILDTQARTPVPSTIVTLPGRTVIIHGAQANPLSLERLQAAGFELVEMATANDHIDLPAFLSWCGQQAFNRVWLEAGATLTGAFAEQGLLDELWLYQAPIMLGGATRPVADFRLDSLKQAHRFDVDDVRFVGKDIRWQLLPAFP